MPEWFNGFDEREKVDRPVEELAQWMSEFNGEEDTPTQVQPTSEPESEAELPDWLSGPVDESSDMEAAKGVDEEDLPDWLSEAAGEETPTQISPSPEQEDDEALPDWLSGPGLEEETESTDVAEDESLPDWLSETDVGEELPTPDEPEEAPEAEGDLPDWLSEFADDEEEADLSVALSDTAEERSLTDWLSDFDDDRAEPVVEDAVSETAGEDSLPGWLSEFEDDEAAPVVEDAASETAEDEILSDWLSDFESPAAEEADEEDWLADLSEGEPETTGPSFSVVEEESQELEKEEEVEGDLPDWLSDMPSYDTKILSDLDEEADETDDIFAELEDSGLSSAGALPDWLSDVAPAEEEPELEEAAEEPEDDGYPDWLSDLPDDDTFEEEDLDSDGDTDWLAALALDEPWPETADEEEIVAQIDELETPEPEPTGPSQELKGVPKELVGSDIPDWMQEDMPPSGPALEDTGEEYPFGLGESEIPAGELPDWLQEMKPAELETPSEEPGYQIDFSSVETQDEWQDILENMPAAPNVMPGGAELSEGEIPAWLQALKPRDLSETEDELDEIDEPPETEGPLTGLRGVLPVAAVVAESTASLTPVRYTISKEQQQQIALLHRLTHEEPEAKKQVEVKKAATFSTGWRAFLGILLLLVVLAGVILPGTDIGLPETSLPVPESALDTFNTMDAVSGRSVLVAFEYTPAMAGELDPIALMLMRQLAENGNRVLTISQSAVGTAVANQLVGQVDGLDSRALPLLTGEAVGLRSLGSCLSNTAENCSSLYDTRNNELLADLGNVGLVIVLTSDRGSLVNWIEQVESQNEAPVIAAVTQPLGPLTIPYVSSGQLDGTLNGIPAASAYEKRLRGLDGSAFEQFTVQTIVMWVVIVSLIITSVVYGASGVAERRTKKGNE